MYTHNEWAEVIRDILDNCIGYDYSEWPEWTDAFIYDLSRYLSARDACQRDLYGI